MAGELLHLSVRCDEYAPRAIREAISHLPDLGWIAGDAMLVASELVSNAVRHSRCTEDELLTVTVDGDGTVRITVLDPGTSGEDAEIVDGSPAFGGLGLKVVSSLAPRWGSERTADGYRVWAELELAGAGR